MKCASPPLKVHMPGTHWAVLALSPPGTPGKASQPGGMLLPLKSWT
jgi:hypothetical protein